MSVEENVNGVRMTALDRIERSARNSRMAFIAAALVEAAFLVGFFLLADLSNRTHVLLLLATVAVYTILALGMAVLGAHVSRSTLRVLHAVELLDRDSSAKQSTRG